MALSVANAEAQLNNAVLAHASLVSRYIDKFQTLETTVITGAQGERGPATLNELTKFRNNFNSLISRESVASFLTPSLRELGEAIGAPSGLPIPQLFDFLYKYYGDTPRTIQSRGISFDTSFSVSGTGNGTLIRLVKGKYAEQIEACHVENKTLKCIADQTRIGSSGRHNDLFRMEGQPVGANDFINAIQMTKSGVSGVREFNTTGTESKILNNGNLTTKNATGSTTTMFSNWTLDSTTGVAVDTTTVHIADYGKTPVSAKISAATRSMTQRITRPLKENNPYLPFCAYNREDGAAPAGTQIRLDWGSKNQTLTLGGSETAFNYFVVDRDENLWLKNFYQDEIDFVVSVPTLASGYINISMIHFYEMIFVDGCWWAIIPGSTPFQKDDNFGTIADSFTSADSILQRYLVYAFGRYLNHSGTPDNNDPTLP